MRTHGGLASSEASLPDEVHETGEGTRPRQLQTHNLRGGKAMKKRMV